MNKQRYLAELRRLLVFMTDEDRDRTVRRYSYMFDAAGPEGEAALIAEIGSPTKAAIGLSRGYVMGSVKEPEPIPRAEPVPAPKPAPPQGEKASEEPWEDIPAFELPEIVDETAAEVPAAEPVSGAEPESPAPDTEPETEAAPAQENEPEPEPTAAKEASVSAAEEPPEEEVVPPAVRVERSMPLWLGIPLFILVTAALVIPIAVVILVLAVVFLAPGCAVLFGAWLVFVGGLWCTGFMADAILLFGVCAIVLALGLLILFLGLWLDVKMIGGYGKAVKWLSGELLGRKVSAYE